MSGIVGIINLDGAPVDAQLLQRMTAFMAYRGPDAQDTWVDGHVGLGHTLLRTTPESMRERQPCSLEGQVWITADARIDDRQELVQALRARGRDASETAPDVELILHAYHVWGEDCIRHLLGDFAFAIWDGRQQRLFCARDHFGVKLFYYAQVGECLVFSNTLDCIRGHPAVSDELNDLAIADFLLSSFNQDPATTAFAHIQRLPPAHSMIGSAVSLRLNHYWTLPTDGHIRYKRKSEYVEHFIELLRAAVNDRLRTDHVGVLMSGGLDSTAIAATARDLLLKQYETFDLRAYTAVYDKWIPDQERYYSGLAAEALDIPIQYLVASDYAPFERWDQPELRMPEPLCEPLRAVYLDQYRQIAAHSRVVLTGCDGDALLNESPRPYMIALLKNRQFGRLAADVGWYVLSQRRLPLPGMRGTLRRWIGKQSSKSLYPVWLDRAFAAQLDLAARWEHINRVLPPSHPTRPDAYKTLATSPVWLSTFETSDAGTNLFPIENRHPLIDLRLVNYALAIPPVPWCVRKELIRAAMRGVLPEPVRRRPKSPLAGDPVLVRLRQPGAQWVDHFEPTAALAKYVDRLAIPPVAAAGEDFAELWMNLRPLSLNYWLQYIEPQSHI